MTVLRRCLLVASFTWFIASSITAQGQEAVKAAESPDKKADWSKYGVLGKTDLKCEDGQPVYALRDGDKLITYVASIKGKSLDSFLGSVVSVYGPTMDLPNGKAQYVLGSHVALAEKLQNRVLGLIMKGNYDEAIAKCTEALRLNPKDWEAYEGRGLAWMIKKDYQRPWRTTRR